MTTTIATIGAVIEVTPGEEMVFESESESYLIDDLTSFRFRVEGRLEDGQIFYGLFGPIIAGPERYTGLICNIMVRYNETDWRTSSKCGANFKVGPNRVTRFHEKDFRHPDGTELKGYPRISRFGSIEVVSHSV